MEASLAAEYWQLKQQETAIAQRLAKLRETLIKKTGERRAGSFTINVTSTDRETLDQEAAKDALQKAGIPLPIKVTPQVRLTVTPSVKLPVIGQ